MWMWLEVDIEIPVPTHNPASVFMAMDSRATEPACLPGDTIAWDGSGCVLPASL